MLFPRSNVVLDLETLGTEPGCKIIQIGAVSFQVKPEDKSLLVLDTFNALIKRHSEKQSLFQEEADALAFWARQPASAQEVISTGNEDITEAIERFTIWLAAQRNHNPQKHLNLWGNSPSFDCVLLKHVITKLGYAVPWQFYEEFDIRTIYNLYKQIKNEDPKAKIKRQHAHDAVGDCIFQIQYLLPCIEKMFGD